MEAQEFREKVLPVSQKIFRYAWRLLGNTHDAEDAVQDISTCEGELVDVLNSPEV